MLPAVTQTDAFRSHLVRRFVKPGFVLLNICRLTTAALIAALLASAPASAADSFNALKGSWSGSGNARFASGQSEKLRCSARYSGGGDALTLNVKCASSASQINLSGNLDASGNKVSGSWSESSFGLSGSANGSVSGNRVRLRIDGGISGVLTMAVSDGRLTFALSSAGASLTGVNVSMGRR